MHSFSIVFVFACGLVRTLAVDAATAILAIKVARERLDESDWGKEIIGIRCNKIVQPKRKEIALFQFEYAPNRGEETTGFLTYYDDGTASVQANGWITQLNAAYDEDDSDCDRETLLEENDVEDITDFCRCTI